MAINWFEGGRRISKLFIGIAGLGGMAYVALSATPPVRFSTSAPDEPWKLSFDGCNYPSDEKYLDQHDFGNGTERSVSLCFEASIEDKIPYSLAPAPAPPVKVTSESPQSVPNAPPPLIRIEPAPKWYYLGSAFDDRVEAYTAQRKAEFELTPERESQALANLSKAYWASRYQAFSEAIPWVLGFAALIWIFTFLTGWIMRGFADVPRGQDFRPPKLGA